MDASPRTCRAPRGHGVQQLVAINSISSRRVPTAGRAAGTGQMQAGEWAASRERSATAVRSGAEDDGRFDAWCAVEQDRDPTLDVSPLDDAGAERTCLASVAVKNTEGQKQ